MVDKSLVASALEKALPSTAQTTINAMAAIVARNGVSLNGVSFREVLVDNKGHDYQEIDLIFDASSAAVSDDMTSFYANKQPIFNTVRLNNAKEAVFYEGRGQPYSGEVSYAGDHATISPFISQSVPSRALYFPEWLRKGLVINGTITENDPGFMFNSRLPDQSQLMADARSLAQSLGFDTLSNIDGYLNKTPTHPYAANAKITHRGYGLAYVALSFAVLIKRGSSAPIEWQTWTLSVPINASKCYGVMTIPGGVVNGRAVADKVLPHPIDVMGMIGESGAVSVIGSSVKWQRLTGLPFEDCAYDQLILNDDVKTVVINDDLSIKFGTGTASLAGELYRSYDYSGYELLGSGQLGVPALTRDKLAEISRSWSSSGGRVSEISFFSAVDCSALRVEDLKYAKDYKRMREKACKTNDFNSQRSPYNKLTFGEVQTKMNAIKERKLWFTPVFELTFDSPKVPRQSGISVEYDETLKKVKISGNYTSEFTQDLDQPGTEEFAEWCGGWMLFAGSILSSDIMKRICACIDVDYVASIGSEFVETYDDRGTELTAHSRYTAQFKRMDLSNQGELIQLHAMNSTVYSSLASKLKVLRLQFTIPKLARNFA